MLVDGEVIVEVKVVDQFTPVHQAQVLSYLKLSGCRIGLMLNCNVKVLRDGIRRFLMLPDPECLCVV